MNNIETAINLTNQLILLSGGEFSIIPASSESVDGKPYISFVIIKEEDGKQYTSFPGMLVSDLKEEIVGAQIIDLITTGINEIYSKSLRDRTPEILARAATRIKEKKNESK